MPVVTLGDAAASTAMIVLHQVQPPDQFGIGSLNFLNAWLASGCSRTPTVSADRDKHRDEASVILPEFTLHAYRWTASPVSTPAFAGRMGDYRIGSSV